MNEYKLTNRFMEALNWAVINTIGETRKGSTVPGPSHPLAVASLVMDYGGNEDEVLGALLHDEAEDGGGEETLQRITSRFGGKVARIVRECSDALPSRGESKKPWRERKNEHLAKLQTANESSQLVYLADKVHNMRSLVLAYTLHGEKVWERFNGGKDGTLWYYAELIDIFQKSAISRELLYELKKSFFELKKLIQGKSLDIPIEKVLETFSIVNLTTENLGNFGLYRGEVHLIDRDGQKIMLSNFINSIVGFETVTVDDQLFQGQGIHFGDIVGSELVDIVKPAIFKDKMKTLFVDELVKKDYFSVDGKIIYRFSRGSTLKW